MRVFVESQKRCDLVHALASMSMVSIVEAAENASQLRSNRVATRAYGPVP
jgi:predicted transcriptional regulator